MSKSAIIESGDEKMKALLERLRNNYSAYSELHAGTAKMDLDIIQKRASGKSAIQTSMEIPCSEATVYRAINRVRYFLEKEMPLLQSALPKKFWVHRAIELWKMPLSLIGHKLLFIFVAQLQRMEDTVARGIVHDYIPGLNNKCQRDSVLEELDVLVVTTSEDPSKRIKVFKQVTYSGAHYSFQFTKQALPYFDPMYALHQMFGIKVNDID